MTCRLAKESDTIIVLHVPCAAHLISRNTDYFSFLDNKADGHKSYQPSNPSSTRLTTAMHKAQQAAAAQRREQIVTHYRNLGYNVFCADPIQTGSLDAYCEASKAYGVHLAYATELQDVLNLPHSANIMDRYVIGTAPPFLWLFLTCRLITVALIINTTSKFGCFPVI